MICNICGGSGRDYIGRDCRICSTDVQVKNTEYLTRQTARAQERSVIWAYELDQIIGNCVIEPDGTVTFKITDTALCAIIEQGQRVAAVSIYVQPAKPKIHIQPFERR